MKAPLVVIGLLWSAVVLAQSFGGSQPGGGPVTITTPDGGLPVSVTGTPTVNSQLVAPDGGLRVTLGSDVVPVSGSVSAAISNTPSVTVSGTPNVAVTNTPAVTVSNRVDANVATAPGTYLGVAGDSTGARLEVAIPAGVAVTNTPSVSVANSPTVSLTSASLATITAATGKGSCTYMEGNPATALGNTATNVPASPMALRTAITITNTSSNPNKRVQCVPGGTASATLGKPIYSGGATWKWEGAQAGWVLSCICVDNGNASTGCAYQSEEERCYQ